MPLIIVVIGIIALLFLIMHFKLNTFVSLVVVSFGVALALGVPMNKVIHAIESGIGGTLGHIALIFGVGAMLGRLIADAGGAHRIAITLINYFGRKKVEWAVITASFIIGIALFFEVGLVLLIPIVFTMAREMKISPLYLGVPMCASLLAAHCYLPPHPGPTVIAGEYGADLGQVLLFGVIIAIPTVLISGPLYNRIAQKIVPGGYSRVGNIDSLSSQKTFRLEETPGFGISVLTAMLPVIMMALATIIDLSQNYMGLPENLFFRLVSLIGSASVAMVISLFFAVYTMGIRRNCPVTELMDSCSSAVNAIGMMLLIIGGGGAFKQVLIEGGVGTYIAHLFTGTSASPIVFAWGVAAILRISLGSATVAAISTSGLVIPLLSGASPSMLALVTLATGAGSAVCSHVNDAGFWMFKEFFGLSMKETFGTWTTLSTIASVVGLAMIILLSKIFV